MLGRLVVVVSCAAAVVALADTGAPAAPKSCFTSGAQSARHHRIHRVHSVLDPFKGLLIKGDTQYICAKFSVNQNTGVASFSWRPLRGTRMRRYHIAFSTPVTVVSSTDTNLSKGQSISQHTSHNRKGGELQVQSPSTGGYVTKLVATSAG
jgi:hypothetical protein